MNDNKHIENEAQVGDIISQGATPRFTLEELFRGRSPQRWRAIYAGAFDCGLDVGREVVEE